MTNTVLLKKVVWGGSPTSTLPNLSLIHSFCCHFVHLFIKVLRNKFVCGGAHLLSHCGRPAGHRKYPWIVQKQSEGVWAHPPLPPTLITPLPPYSYNPPPPYSYGPVTFSPSFWNHRKDMSHPWFKANCLDVYEHLKITISFYRDVQTFEEAFSYACPKFISPVPPNFDAPPANFNRVSKFIVSNDKRNRVKLISFTL